MKQTLLTILLLTLLPSSAAKKIDANPINIAALLVEKTDSAKVASTCEYYGFTYQGVEDGYTIMKRPNGDEIKFTFKDNGNSQKYPTVVIQAKGTHKEIEERLKAVNFEKEGNTFTASHNHFSRYITQCNKGQNSTLIFRRLYNHSHK